MSSLLLLFITLLASSRGQEELSVYPIIMPMVVPSKNEIYLCTSIDLSATNETFWVRGFEPRVSEARVHHMIVAASATRPPRTPFNVWNCGNEKHQDPNYPNHSVFPDSADGVDTTIYLWAYGGRRTMLPPDTAFKVGGDSQIRHLVLQVHYINVENVEYGAEKDKEGDSSGVYLYYTREPQKRLAGVLSMHVDTNVPRLARSFQDVACKIQENKVLHPYSVVMHTHRLGKVVSAWRVRRNLAGEDQWTLIDKRDPLKGQHFYPIQDPNLTLRYGDTMAYRCTMVNLSSRDVKQGLASYDEMCDLYMMYYVESNDETQLLEQSNFCWSQGPPEVTWHNLGLRNVPNILASSLP